ncbi:MAG: c-type cytochrome [Ferruginibacter sp.]
MNKQQEEDKTTQQLTSVINKLVLVIAVLVVGYLSIPIVIYYKNQESNLKEKTVLATTGSAAIKKDTVTYWTPADISTIKDMKQKKVVEYGKELVAHTARYLGPNGSILKISNGMNCQNCHLQAGTVVFGNNYGSVASLYPKLRARSGAVENIYKRVNDCIERSLNGTALDTTSKEMQAIASYINFVGSNVAKGKKAAGSGFKDLAFLDRAADPNNGQAVYTAKCQTCHQPDGAGLFPADKTEYTYPALWGNNSFNDGAGLYRISNFAKYIKYNMPLGVTHENPQLSDEEAWDVAAFITSQSRPHLNVPKDWPDVSKKPVDHPFGPYADNFSEKQHKLGPFKPIVEEQKKKEEAAKQKIVSALKK